MGKRAAVEVEADDIEEVDAEEVVDLTNPDKPVGVHRFRIGEDVFEATRVLPAAARYALTGIGTRDASGKVRVAAKAGDLLMEFMGAVLMPASQARFFTRLSSAEHPIDEKELGAAVTHLIRCYGGDDHPPTPSPTS